MKFRSRFFGVFFILALLWLGLGYYVTSQAVVDVSATPVPGGSAAKAVQTLGITSVGMSVFLCTGLPLAFLFGLLAWRNAVGLRTERRHQETIAALEHRP